MSDVEEGGEENPEAENAWEVAEDDADGTADAFVGSGGDIYDIRKVAQAKRPKGFYLGALDNSGNTCDTNGKPTGFNKSPELPPLGKGRGKLKCLRCGVIAHGGNVNYHGKRPCRMVQIQPPFQRQ